MPRSHLARLYIILFSVAALAAPPAWAAPRSQADIFARTWELLATLWSAAGCVLDPHGGCLLPTADAGCKIDPHGECQPSTADEGCKIDPHGGCAFAEERAPALAPAADEGCKLDPYGGCAPGS